MKTHNIEEALKLVGEAMKVPLPEAAKAFVQPTGGPITGLQGYDLEAPAKLLYPVITPLRNSIPRVGGGIGTAVNWRAITGINTTSVRPGVSEGNRGAAIAHTTADYTAAYKGIGLEDYVTFEADYAGQSFDDVKARAVTGTLQATMIAEETWLLGGYGSTNAGMIGAAPALSTSTTGGSLPATTTYSVICVPLTLEGMLYSSVANGIPGQITKTNTDGSVDTFGGGSGKPSSATTIATGAGSTNSITATETPQPGALGYAWFWGASGSELLGAVTSVPAVTITAVAAGTQTIAAIPGGGTTDWSMNALAFDGILAFIFKPGSNSYVFNCNNNTLTAGTDGSIKEFDDALQYFWDKYKLSPSTIWVSSQEQRYIRGKILTTAGSSAAQRFVFDMSQNKIMGGTMAVSYLNPFGMPVGQDYAQGAEIPIKVHPNLPPGTVVFQTERLPYKMSNVNNILQVKTRRDYYQTEWPLRTRKYEYGVYADEVLQCYFTPAFGVITGIKAG